MPTTPKILVDLQKRKFRKETHDVDVIDLKDITDYKLLCPKDNVQMLIFTDPKTGKKEGVMCPVCEKRVMPSQSYYNTQTLEAKKKKLINSVDNATSTQELIGKRDTLSLEDTTREELYMRQESATKTMTKLKYAGKKREEDSDEKMLRMHGFSIISSSEKNPV